MPPTPIKDANPRVTLSNQPLPKCERTTPPANAAHGFSYHRLRKAVHVVCVVVFSSCRCPT